MIEDTRPSSMCKLKKELQNLCFYRMKMASNSLLIGRGKRYFDKKKLTLATLLLSQFYRKAEDAKKKNWTHTDCNQKKIDDYTKNNRWQLRHSPHCPFQLLLFMFKVCLWQSLVSPRCVSQPNSTSFYGDDLSWAFEREISDYGWNSRW